MVSGISTSNPGTRRVFSRRKMLDKWRRSPRWKEMLATHAHIPGAVCAHCKMEHGQQRYDRQGNPSIDRNGKPILVVLTINHKTRDLYLNEDLYLTWHPEKMEVCCTLCNKVYEKGEKPCPKCLAPGKVTYIKWYDTECTACYFREHPDELRKAEGGRASFKQSIKEYNAGQAEKRRKAKVKHPCRSHRIGGACALSMINSQCRYSASKALKPAPVGCGSAVAKKAAVKA